MFIGIDFVLNVPNASNTAAFDRANSAIGAAVAEVLRNPVLLIPRKMNSRRAHGANGDGEGSKT